MTARRPAGDTDNLVTLPDLNEDILLNELKARYRKDDIYVRTVAMWLCVSYSYVRTRVAMRCSVS